MLIGRQSPDSFPLTHVRKFCSIAWRMPGWWNTSCIV